MSYFEFELASNDSIKFVGGESREKERYQFQDVLDNMKEAHTVRIITYNVQFGKDNELNRYLSEINPNADVKIIIGVPGFTYRRNKGNADEIINSIDKFYINGYNKNVKLAVSPYNHSKIIGTENVLYIGSQNLSWSSRRNYEAGVVLHNSSDIKTVYDRMFDNLWDRSIEYLEEDTRGLIKLLYEMKIIESYLQSKIEEIDFGIFEDAQPFDYIMDIDIDEISNGRSTRLRLAGEEDCKQ